MINVLNSQFLGFPRRFVYFIYSQISNRAEITLYTILATLNGILQQTLYGYRAIQWVNTIFWF